MESICGCRGEYGGAGMEQTKLEKGHLVMCPHKMQKQLKRHLGAGRASQVPCLTVVAWHSLRLP